MSNDKSALYVYVDEDPIKQFFLQLHQINRLPFIPWLNSASFSYGQQ